MLPVASVADAVRAPDWTAVSPKEAVVVGIDGSGYGLSAARWAAREAALRSVPVRLVHAYWLPSLRHADIAPATNSLVDLREFGAGFLRDAEMALRRDHPTLDVSSRLVYGRTVDVLARRAADAQLLVVGRRGGRRADAFVDSSEVCANIPGRSALAAVPAVLPEPGGVVAGIDERRDCGVVLERAFAAAALRAAMLTVIRCVPAVSGMPDVGRIEGRATGRPVTDDDLAALLLTLTAGFPDVVVHLVDSDRSVPDAVRAAVPGTELAVIGRGHRSGADRPIGRSALELIRTSPIPVIVVSGGAEGPSCSGPVGG